MMTTHSPYNARSSAPTFHTATLKDVRKMLDWAAQEGWNPGLMDAEAFWGADEEGFFVARIAGEMIAAISIVNHDENMAFLGLYICKPAFRGKGIGFGLWQHALKHAGSRCIGLDGVAAQEGNYEKSGFIRYGSVTRLQGDLPNQSSVHTRPVDLLRDTDALLRLDRQANGYERAKFLKHWILAGSPSRKTVVAEQNGTITGFATARLCFEGLKVGPVIALDDETALSLISAAAFAVGATKIFVDLPDCQKTLRAKLETLDFKATFETAHMYRDTPPETSPLLRAVATLECG